MYYDNEENDDLDAYSFLRNKHDGADKEWWK